MEIMQDLILLTGGVFWGLGQPGYRIDSGQKKWFRLAALGLVVVVAVIRFTMG